MFHCWQYPKMLCLMSALHQNVCHWDQNPNLWILIPVTHLDCVSSVFPLDYGSHAILWIVFLVSTLDSVYISLPIVPNCNLDFSGLASMHIVILVHHGGLTRVVSIFSGSCSSGGTIKAFKIHRGLRNRVSWLPGSAWSGDLHQNGPNSHSLPPLDGSSVSDAFAQLGKRKLFHGFSPLIVYRCPSNSFPSHHENVSLSAIHSTPPPPLTGWFQFKPR